MAKPPRMARVSVCMAATALPIREFITLVALKRWKASCGRRKRSSRNGMAAFRLPKKLSSPAPASRT